MNAFITQCDEYLDSRTGRYEYRAVRYRLALKQLTLMGLSHDHTITDLGAGWTEFDYTARTEFDWRGRYIPIDGGIDGTDLESWNPYRVSDFYVALEILEHLYDPAKLIETMQANATRGIVITVPDPEQVDVLGMDDTHVFEVSRSHLEHWGFTVTSEQLYGGYFSEGRNDALLGVWTPKK